MTAYWVVLSFVIMLILFSLKVSVAVSIGLASLAFMVLTGIASGRVGLLPLNMVHGVNSFPILAIPLFVWSGHLIAHESISDRLFGVIRYAVGWWSGGLLQFNMLFSAIFAAMSGSAVADVAGPGRVIYRIQVDAGYGKGISAAATAASAIMGPIIPPSIPLILWGVAANVSIGRLWAGAIIPGILIGIGLMFLVYVLSVIRGYPREEIPSLSAFLSGIYAAFPALLTPLIIWVGVFGGIVTPTEAAAVATAYAIFITFVFYREISLKEHARIMIASLKDTAAILFIVSVASHFGWLMAYTRAPAYLLEWIFRLTENPLIVLLLIIFALLFLGCFMETISVILIVAPVMAFLVPAAGLDPVHVGVTSVVALMIGLITPPFGILIFVTERVTGVEYMTILKDLVPFYVILFLVLLITIFFPQTVTYLPDLIYG